MPQIAAESRLNSDVSLAARLADALAGAAEFDVAVAYAKLSGVEILDRAGLPQRSRFVIGTGFALTDPDAVEALDASGAEVRVVIDSPRSGASASAFHPKLYLVRGNDELVVFSGSGNLTGGGLQTNIEQFEELRTPLGSAVATTHDARFETLFNLGEPFSELRESGAWEAYKTFANQRRERERNDAAEERRLAELMRDRTETAREAAQARAAAQTATRPRRRSPRPSEITTHRTLSCVVCGRTMPETKFPTRPLKTGIERGEGCRECRDNRPNAYDMLLEDLHQIYYRSGAEVKLPNDDGELKPYWPRRYRQGLRRAESQGQKAVLAYVKGRVASRTALDGFNKLMGVGRPELTVEWLVADEERPYHHMFDAETVPIARERLND